MLTIVVHYEDAPQDWSLVKGFFNPLVSSGSLIFIRHQVSRMSAYQELLNQVVDYVHKRMIDQWQLVWMMAISPEKDYRERLSSQLDRFQKRFLTKLRVKRLAPKKIYVMAIDDLDRDEDGTPVDPFLKQVWKLDLYGYLAEKPSAEVNLFYETELEQLDQLWGSTLDLREAGPLEAPRPEFLKLLLQRVSLMKECFHTTMIIPKRRMIEQYRKQDPSAIPTDILLHEELDAIEQEFMSRLDQIPIVPLSPRLVNYSPSQDLKEVIKGVIGTQASLARYIFIRIPYPQDFPARRIKALLKVTYLINAIALNPAGSTLWKEGNAYTVEVMFRDQELQALLNAYLSKLYRSRTKVENYLLLRRQALAPHYGELSSTPYSQVDLQEQEQETPKLTFNYKHRQSFDQALRSYGEAASELIRKREQHIEAAANEGMRRLDILARQEEAPLEYKLQEPQDAIRYLNDEAAITREELLQHAPTEDKAVQLSQGRENAVHMWHREIHNAKQEVVSMLKGLPTPRQIGWLSFFLLAVLLLPAVMSLSQPVTLLSTGIYPAVAVILLVLCLQLSRTKQTSRINQRVQETTRALEELIAGQLTIQKRNTEYLNKLYQLQKLTKRAEAIQQYNQLQVTQNLQLRYHQAALQEAIRDAQRLVALLGIPFKHSEEAPASEADEQSWFLADHQEHASYSPLALSTNEQRLRADESTELVFGVSRNDIQEPLLYPVERIVSEYDRVYRI